MYKTKVWTKHLSNGSIGIYNFNPNWRPGQIVKNPMSTKEFHSMSKDDRKYLKPNKNYLFKMETLLVVKCEKLQFTTDDHEGQRISSLVDYVEVKSISELSYNKGSTI